MAAKAMAAMKAAKVRKTAMKVKGSFARLDAFTPGMIWGMRGP